MQFTCLGVEMSNGGSEDGKILRRIITLLNDLNIYEREIGCCRVNAGVQFMLM